MIAANAGPDEIEKYLDGQYSPDTIATIIAWNRGTKQINQHIQHWRDEVAKRERDKNARSNNRGRKK